MKQKDVAFIIVVVVVSGILSFVISDKVFAPPKNRQQSVETVEKITSEFSTPDTTYFNKNSIDPAQLIQIGNSSNPNPFNGS